MQRYFLNEPYKEENPIQIKGDDFHHITRVMRMDVKDFVYVVFADKKSAKAKIETITSDAVEVTIVQWETVEKELPINVSIASGLPKGDKLELIIQKGTELGAHRFIPFNADRSIVKWDEKKAGKKVERWKKIAKEAAEQSHRQYLPEVDIPISFKQLMILSKSFDYVLLAYEEESRLGEVQNLVKTLQSIQAQQSLLIIFGPEGGLSDSEVQECLTNGIVPCGLGPRILRTETAPLYALSAISYQFDLMR